MLMVGHLTMSIYSRYAIADEFMLKDASAQLNRLHEFDQAPDNGQRMGKVESLMRTQQKAQSLQLVEFQKRGCGQGQNRTADTRIFSPLLYRLSYLARSLEYSLKVVGSQDETATIGGSFLLAPR
jgi:hypothetical protein